MCPVTLEVVTLPIHEDVVHENHAEHAGIDMEVTEDKYETCRLEKGREQLLNPLACQPSFCTASHSKFRKLVLPI